MADEVQQLIMQVQGAAKVAALTDQLKAQKKTMEELAELQLKGPLSGSQQAQFQRAAEAAVQSTEQLGKLTRTMHGLVNTQGMMQISYGLQDVFAAQGGIGQKLNAASNNLQMLAQSMGIGGPWMIAVTGMIVGIQLLANNWDRIQAAISGLPDPKEVAKQAAEIKKKLEEHAKQWDALKKPTPLEKTKAAPFEEVIALGLGEDVGTAASETILADMTKPPAEWTDQQREDWLKKHYGEYNTDVGATAGLRDEEKQDLKSRRQKQVREARLKGQNLVMEANKPGPAGEAARKELLEIVRKNPGAFPYGVEDTLAGIPEVGAKVTSDYDYRLNLLPEEMADEFILTSVPQKLRDLTLGRLPVNQEPRMNAEQVRRQNALNGRPGFMLDAAGNVGRPKIGGGEPPVGAENQPLDSQLAQAANRLDYLNGTIAQRIAQGLPTNKLAHEAAALDRKVQRLAQQLDALFGGQPAGNFTQLPEWTGGASQ